MLRIKVKLCLAASMFPYKCFGEIFMSFSALSIFKFHNGTYTYKFEYIRFSKAIFILYMVDKIFNVRFSYILHILCKADIVHAIQTIGIYDRLFIYDSDERTVEFCSI